MDLFRFSEVGQGHALAADGCNFKVPKPACGVIFCPDDRVDMTVGKGAHFGLGDKTEENIWKAAPSQTPLPKTRAAGRLRDD